MMYNTRQQALQYSFTKGCWEEGILKWSWSVVGSFGANPCRNKRRERGRFLESSEAVYTRFRARMSGVASRFERRLLRSLSSWGGRGGRWSLLEGRGGRVLVGVLARVEGKGRVVDAAQLEEEDAQEDGDGEDVEDTVPDHLGGDRDDVTALGTTPRDRVGDEHEGEVARGLVVPHTERLARGELRAGSVPEEDEPGNYMSTDVKMQ